MVKPAHHVEPEVLVENQTHKIFAKGGRLFKIEYIRGQEQDRPEDIIFWIWTANGWRLFDSLKGWPDQAIYTLAGLIVELTDQAITVSGSDHSVEIYKELLQ
jgi:hypothetical protein